MPHFSKSTQTDGILS